MAVVTALGVEQFLPLADHAHVPIVKDTDLDRQLLLHRCIQLGHRHIEAVVAVDVDDRRVRASDLGPDGRRQAEPHRAQPAGSD